MRSDQTRRAGMPRERIEYVKTVNCKRAIYASSVRTRAFELVRRTPSCCYQGVRVRCRSVLAHWLARAYNAGLLDDGNALAAGDAVSDLASV